MIDLALPCTVITADIVGSSSGRRSRQGHLDRSLERVLDDALAESRYRREEWSQREKWFRRPDGDSVTLVAPAVVPKAWIAADFVRDVEIALRRVNEHTNEPSRLRVRMAIAHSEIEVEGPHIRGAAVRIAARLRDSEALRDQVSATDDDLALIVSDTFFHEVIEERERDLDPAVFHEVVVTANDGLVRGWIRGSRGRSTESALDPVPTTQPRRGFPDEPGAKTGGSKTKIGKVRGRTVAIGNQGQVAEEINNQR